MTIDTCDDDAGLCEVVLVHTHEDERGNDQQEQQDHHELGMLADGFEHGLSSFNGDRKSTRLNSSHLVISYAVFCLKKKKNHLKHVRHHHHTKLTKTLQV